MEKIALSFFGPGEPYVKNSRTGEKCPRKSFARREISKRLNSANIAEIEIRFVSYSARKTWRSAWATIFVTTNSPEDSARERGQERGKTKVVCQFGIFGKVRKQSEELMCRLPPAKRTRARARANAGIC